MTTDAILRLRRALLPKRWVEQELIPWRPDLIVVTGYHIWSLLMRRPFDEVVRVRVPAAVNDRLRTTADRYARAASDIIREGIVLQLDRLGRRQHPPEPDWQSPDVA